MWLYRKVYTNLKSGAEVFGDWCMSEKRAERKKIPGESYMHLNPNYSFRIEQREWTLVKWMRERYGR